MGISIKRAILLATAFVACGALTAVARPSSQARWHRLVGRQASISPAWASAPCPADGGVCHSVLVPLDRDHPSGAKIAIRYEVFAHTDTSRPALPPVFLTQGGPGASILNFPFAHGAWRDMLLPLNDRQDIVLVDQRGVGDSGAIVCPALEAGQGNLFDAAHACGVQLGATSDLYSSADVAADLDAVRRAIGAPTIDFFGSSYAAVDIQSYAVRYTQRLHAAVLDSPVFPKQDRTQNEPQAVLSTASQMCSRSRMCSPSTLYPAAQIAWLAHRLRMRPLDGVGIDDSGGTHSLRVTEGWLVARILLNTNGFIAQSEVAAAAVALRHGDTRPLLRLAAEGDSPPWVETHGDPMVFSAGDNEARVCTDFPFPWNKRASESVRRAQYAAWLHGLPAGAFAPFSVGGWLPPYPTGSGPTECIRWAAPTHHRTQPVPPGASFPSIPALVLSGSIDLTVPSGDARQVAAQFPNAHFIEVAGSGHDTTLNTNSKCAQTIVIHFFRTLAPGDTTCARTPGMIFPAVGAFPTTLAGERPALRNPAAGDQSTEADRKAVTSAWDAIRDTLWHQYIYGTYPNDGTGPGLRSGTFHIRYDTATNTTTLVLSGVGFTRDVAVSGTVVHNADSVLDATVTLTGRIHGTLRLKGFWLDPRATAITVLGSLNGRTIAVREPTN